MHEHDIAEALRAAPSLNGAFFQQGKDGVLRPWDLPAGIAATAATYETLAKRGFTFEEIGFIWRVATGLNF